MRIRIAVWNCNMRLHDKLEGLRRLAPDVIVVPECACPEVLLRRAPGLSVSGMLWTGRNARKGLGLLAFGPWRLRAVADHDPRAETVLAACVEGPAEIRLAAVWAHRHAREPFPEALARLSPFLSQSPAAIAGDFNDALLRPAVAGRVENMGFVSAYHLLRGAAHGEETEATLYHRRREGKRRHRDLVLLDRRLAKGLRHVAVGRGFAWTGASDHAPVLAEIETRL